MELPFPAGYPLHNDPGILIYKYTHIPSLQVAISRKRLLRADDNTHEGKKFFTFLPPCTPLRGK
jgi:hypothetical protein